MLTHAFPTRRSSDLQIGRPPKADRPGPRGRRLPPAGGRVMAWNTPTASCEGKVGFATKGGALENLNRIKKRGRRRHCRHKDKGHAVAALHPYRCSTCHQWHLGNASEGKPAK